MARLTLIVTATLICAGPARADTVDRWTAHIQEASRRFDVPEDWIRRVMRIESAGLTTRNGRPIVSRAGALGLMQLMPGTWDALRARFRLGSDPHEPRANILAGTAYLRAMHDRFGYPGLFAAYNAGPNRYARYLTGRASLPRETAAYLLAASRAAGPSTRPAGGRAPRGGIADRTIAREDRRDQIFVSLRFGTGAGMNSTLGSEQ